MAPNLGGELPSLAPAGSSGRGGTLPRARLPRLAETRVPQARREEAIPGRGAGGARGVGCEAGSRGEGAWEPAPRGRTQTLSRGAMPSAGGRAASAPGVLLLALVVHGNFGRCVAGKEPNQRDVGTDEPRRLCARPPAAFCLRGGRAGCPQGRQPPGAPPKFALALGSWLSGAHGWSLLPGAESELSRGGRNASGALITG